jgi:hypothetical protein
MNEAKVRKIVVSTLALVVLVGLTPLLWLLWWSRPQTVEPFSVPVTVKSGSYISPPFVTAVPAKDEQYQVELYFLPVPRTPLNLEWKVVNNGGAVLAHGEYRERHALGNDAILGFFRPTVRSTQRVMLNVENEGSLDTTLHVGIPERSLDAAFGFPFAIGWALVVLVVGIGVIGLAFRYHKR